MIPNVVVAVTGDKEAIARLRASGPAATLAVKKQITKLTLNLRTHILTNKLKGQVLNHITGQLWRSISWLVESDQSSVTGKVFATADVKYAAIHEFGGIIVPRTASALRFKIGEQWITTKRVVMPERSYLRTGLADFRERIFNEVKQAAEGAMLP